MQVETSSSLWQVELLCMRHGNLSTKEELGWNPGKRQTCQHHRAILDEPLLIILLGNSGKHNTNRRVRLKGGKAQKDSY